MTDQVFNLEKMKHLEAVNKQLNDTVARFSSHLRAHKQALSELFDANLGLKADCISLEDQLKNLAQEHKSAMERCQSLEKEKADSEAEKDIS